jgi:O-antigen ligase
MYFTSLNTNCYFYRMESMREITKKTAYYLTHLVAFCIPLSSKLVTPMVILLCVSCILNAEFRSSVLKRLKNPGLQLFLSFYFMCILGYFISDNKQVAGFDLQVKFALFIFPVFLCSNDLVAGEKRYLFLRSFIEGCLSAALLCICLAIYKYYVSYDISSLFYVNLSFVKHPSYFAMELCFAFLAALILFLRGSQTKDQLFYLLLISLFFSVMVIMLSSKSGILSLLLLWLGVLGYLLIIRKNFLISAIFAGFIILSALAFPRIAPYSFNRIAIALGVVKSTDENSKKESTNNRIMIWHSSLEVIRNNKLGVGTGDVKKHLTMEYEKMGMALAKERQFNAHNQYLQSAMAIGLQGLLILFLCLFLPMIKALKQGNYIYIFFLLLVALNFLFESMLETQAGVIFYAFFNSLLFKNDNT